MVCSHCGANTPADTKFCPSCGTALAEAIVTEEHAANLILVGFSSKINDPSFTKYVQNTNQWSLVFSIILALAAIIGFFIYGETSSDMENPQALFIGLGIGGMFLFIAGAQIMGRKWGKTWDGTVVDKQVNQKRRKQNTSHDDYYWVDYLEYVVVIMDGMGKKHEIKIDDDDHIYNYYRIGDKVRHHGMLNSYEKYDKSRDSIIFCNACASLNDIQEDHCLRCHCPLLK